MSHPSLQTTTQKNLRSTAVQRKTREHACGASNNQTQVHTPARLDKHKHTAADAQFMDAIPMTVLVQPRHDQAGLRHFQVFFNDSIFLEVTALSTMAAVQSVIKTLTADHDDYTCVFGKPSSWMVKEVFRSTFAA